MDMQGTPGKSTNKGTKNTTDPATKNVITEGAGAVASDSLAAESARSGGAFGDNRDSNPLSVQGSNSTLANTDTSAATTLPPAPNSTEREAQSAQQETSDAVTGAGGAKYPEGTDGQGKFSGVHSDQGYVGGSTKTASGNASRTTGAGDDGTSATGGESGSYDGTQGEESRHVDVAPTYVNSVLGVGHVTKPKGNNLTEGGFDSDDKNNASFGSDVGGDKDPGRASLQGFQKTNAQTIGSGPSQVGVSGDGQYDALETDQNL